MIGATTTEEIPSLYRAGFGFGKRRFEVLPLDPPSDELLFNLVRSMAGSNPFKDGRFGSRMRCPEVGPSG